MADMSLEEAKEWLRERVYKGASCPCCTQFAKVYRRPITSTSARVLIAMVRHGEDWINLPDMIRSTPGLIRADEAKLAYWGLIEEEQWLRHDGGRAGWWRVTQKGLLFARYGKKVPKYALIYDGHCMGLEGKDVSILDALGTKFNYRELMYGEDDGQATA